MYSRDFDTNMLEIHPCIYMDDDVSITERKLSDTFYDV